MYGTGAETRILLCVKLWLYWNEKYREDRLRGTQLCTNIYQSNSIR